MRINSKSIIELDLGQGAGPSTNMSNTGLEKLSSGYRINRAGGGVAVLIPHELRVGGRGLPQVICSRGAPPGVQAG